MPIEHKGLKMEQRHVGAAAVVKISGSAGMEEAEFLRRELEALAGQQIPLAILDLSDMSFISSLGLGAIISMHLKSRHHGGKIAIVHPQPAVLNVLETTRLTQLFPIFATIDAAISK